MLPDPIEPVFYFKAYTQVDNANLFALTLFAGSSGDDYSDQTEAGFTLSRDGYTLTVSGSGFVYDGGVPTEGSVGDIAVAVNAVAYTLLSDTAIPLSVFFTSDPLALATTLFSRSDNIGGSPLADMLYGFAGDDEIIATEGNDGVYGGDGNDQVNGGEDDDKLYGDSGDDWLKGGKGDDKLFGGDGFDVANFDDKLSPVVVNLGKGKAAKATIGFNEVDKLKGFEGVWGGIGNDKITGDGDANQLGGNSGDDVLKGKGGDDLLVGFWGLDELTGGKGSDTFYFDRLNGKTNNDDWDLITDFKSGVDKITFLQDVFAELDAGVLSADDFLAAPGAFAGQGGKHIIYDTTNGILYYDPSGDGSAFVFRIAELKGAPQISASDFFIEADLMS